MSGFRFQVNMAFELSGTPVRIYALPANGEVVLESQTTGAMFIASREKLLQQYMDGTLKGAGRASADVRTDAVPTFSRPMSDLKPKVREELTRRCRYIEAICEGGPPVFTAEYLDPILKRVASELGDEERPGITTVYRWHSRLRSSQGDARALIPRTDRRGPAHVKQDTKLQELFTEAIADAYRASPLAQGQDVYGRLNALVQRHNLMADPDRRLTMPSLRTVYRMLERTSTYEKVYLKQGRAAADKRFRAIRMGVQTTRILERVELDHTPLDLFLIDEKTWLPLGRPTLTVVIDHYSRMLLGYYLSFGSPSAAAVMAAIRHAILPKFPAEVTIPELIPENVWPCYGLFSEAYLDNGLEFLGKDLESVALDLGFGLLFCPKRTPHFKGVVERYLKTVNYHFAHQVPGASFARFHKREEYDPLKHALLTLCEFKQLFEKWVVDVYSQTVHRGIGTTPMQRWQDGVKVWEPKLPPDLRSLQRRIGQTSECKLRKDGITLHGIRYNDTELLRILRRYGEGVTVRVVYDPEDLAEILVWGPDDQEPDAVKALDLGYAKGLSVRQNNWLRQLVREQGHAASNREAVLKARSDITAVIEQLMSSRKLKDRRRAAALKGISSTKPAPSSQPPVQTQAGIDSKQRAKPASSRGKRSHAQIHGAGGHGVDAPPLLVPFTLSKRGQGVA